jgi:serine O-acetyltransferase
VAYSSCQIGDAAELRVTERPSRNVIHRDTFCLWRFRLFENIREDWRTYDRQISRQGLWSMAVYRFGRWRYTIRWRWLRMPFSFLYKVLKPVSEVLTGIEFPCEAKVGRRFRIEHFGGIVISGDAVFGDDCVIRNGVTVGLKHTGYRGAPVLGNRVDIGAGAKILGPIKIGDDVLIGANAVVITDIPSNCIAVGVPARVLPRNTVAAASEEPEYAGVAQERSAYAGRI